jgi:hypothetical protein
MTISPFQPQGFPLLQLSTSEASLQILRPLAKSSLFGKRKSVKAIVVLGQMRVKPNACPNAASGPHLPFKLTCDAAARTAEAAVHAVCSILRY